MKTEKPFKKAIPCACGKEGCDMGLIVGKYPENKIKIQIIDKEDIKTVVISKNKLLDALKKEDA